MQLCHENQDLQRRMYETEELTCLQKEQVAVMHDSMQDLRQQKIDCKEHQQEWRLLAEKREKENQYLRVELEKGQKRWTVERENIETKAWVPLQGVESESLYCEQPREEVMPSNERDPISFSTCETAPVQTGLLTSSARITQPERSLSVGITSTLSVAKNSFVPTGATASVPTTSVATIADSNLYQFQSSTQPYVPTVQWSFPEAPQPHIPLSNQPLSSNNPHQVSEHTVGTGHHEPFVMDSGQALQQLAVSVAERQRKYPKFSGESKYDDFDHWLQNIFRFYVPLARYDERGKHLELRSALKEGSPAQRAFDFLELLALGSYTVATQRLKKRFRCMLTPEALRVEFSRLRFKPHQQTIQEFATEVEQMSIRTFPHKSAAERDAEC